jgi:hypothetical protein
MKSATARSKATRIPAPSAAHPSNPDPGYADRMCRVAEVAYYKAAARGFEPGHELEDWLAAEREVK